LTYKQPKNETETHFLLKEISKYILWGWGYNKLGTEVYGMWDNDISKLFHKDGQKGQKNIIDCVGIKKIHVAPRKYHWDMKGIEAKASLSDFKNGFCAAPAFSYIICPINIIPIELIPEKIGCITVDFDIFELKKYSQKIPDMKGVELVRKAQKRIDSRFKSEEAYRKWCQDSLERVAYRCGSELLFWRNYIEFSK
jgi:hypothetical protein